MFETWKIKRELNRVVQQIKEIKPLLLGPVNRIYYDATMRSQIKVWDGEQPETPDIAVILIYQPDGVLPSTFNQIDHFLSHAICPVVISNAPISENDRSQLLQKCRLVIERPNFGYDFGGYRDAILDILERDWQINNLFLLNDSIWFPVRENCDLIDKARADTSDIWGVFYTQKSKKISHWHLHSYFYRFSANIANHETFKSYWQKMPLYQGAKRIVIRQFETKLTAYFVRHGFSASSLYEAADIYTAVGNIDDVQLQRLFDFHLEADQLTKSIFQSITDVDKADPNWRAHADKVVSNRKFGNYFLNSHPYIFLDSLKSPILKKNRDYKFVRQRQEICELGRDANLTENVRKELRDWDKGA